MANATKTAVLKACRLWLAPLSHVLLKAGVTWQEYADIARATYVDVATKRFGIRGRPTNVSRTAILTGLTRREVRRQRDLLELPDELLAGDVTKASLVLSAWHQHPDFIDADGNPRVLSFDGTARSFTALTKLAASSDVPPATLLKELRLAGAIAELPNGSLQALKRNYIPQALDAKMVGLWGTAVADLARTGDHNLTRKSKERARFQRRAANDSIDPAAVAAFEEFLEREGQAFLERADAWLTAHQIAEQDGGARPRVRLGVGLYHIQDEIKQTASNQTKEQPNA